MNIVWKSLKFLFHPRCSAIVVVVWRVDDVEKSTKRPEGGEHATRREECHSQIIREFEDKIK